MIDTTGITPTRPKTSTCDVLAAIDAALEINAAARARAWQPERHPFEVVGELLVSV